MISNEQLLEKAERDFRHKRVASLSLMSDPDSGQAVGELNGKRYHIDEFFLLVQKSDGTKLVDMTQAPPNMVVFRDDRETYGGDDYFVCFDLTCGRPQLLFSSLDPAMPCMVHVVGHRTVGRRAEYLSCEGRFYPAPKRAIGVVGYVSISTDYRDACIRAFDTPSLFLSSGQTQFAARVEDFRSDSQRSFLDDDDYYDDDDDDDDDNFWNERVFINE